VFQQHKKAFIRSAFLHFFLLIFLSVSFSSTPVTSHKRLRVQTVQLTPMIAHTTSSEAPHPQETPPEEKKEPQPIKKKKAPAKKVVKKESPTKPDNSKLLAEALSHLNKSTTANTSSSSKPSSVKPISSLNTDTSLIDKAKEKGSQESAYTDDLVRRLQLGIKLPEHGEASVAITINRSGKAVKVAVTSGTSGAIKQTLSQKLPTLTFSPFGTCFPNEREHTFLLRLSNDLVWSS